jgi:hypothetical protein
MLNGRLPSSVLAPIPQGHLVKSAAIRWNAMCQEAKARYGVTIVPMGSMSSYRTYWQQVYLYAHTRPGWAARPGTSNHGWGLAVDLRTQQMRSIVDAIGAKYGIAKRWSDASWEWWHIKVRTDIGATRYGKPGFQTLRQGSHGARVRKLQRRLRHYGHKRVPVTGYFGWRTKRAVKRFQKKHHLHVDGVVGKRTWRKLT